jgi:hypothetical protein
MVLAFAGDSTMTTFVLMGWIPGGAKKGPLSGQFKTVLRACIPPP